MMRRFIGIIGLFVATSIACTLGGSVAQPTTVAVQATVVVPPTVFVTAATSTTAVSSAPTSVVSGANCTPRSEWPLYSVVSGDTLGTIASRTSSTIDILTTANCLSNSNVLLVGQQLRVPMSLGTLPTPTSDQCPGNISWFFTFTAGAIDRLCPNPAETLSAAGEDFEGGRILWYAASPGASDQRPTIYVIYNDGEWETYVDVWDSSQPDTDPSIVPPAGRFQPAGNLGKVWRENPTVRQRLGWAYEAKIPFTGHMQTLNIGSARPANYVDHWYLDHGKAGIVLRLYSIDMAPNKWEVAGMD